MSRLHCARCDKAVPEGAEACRWDGCRAFYRGLPPLRHLMGKAAPKVEPEAEAPYPARGRHVGYLNRHRSRRQGVVS